MSKQFVAHISPVSGENQSIEEHLLNVAELSRKFAERFNSSDWADAIGKLHDYGKYSEDFQNYIHTASAGKAAERTDHASAGGAEAFLLFPAPIARIMAYCIVGHHSGLPDKQKLEERLCKPLASELPALNIDKLRLMPPFKPTRINMHVWIRMLFSALVDADRLDTEAFMSPDKAAYRGNYASMKELKLRLDTFTMQMRQNARPSRLNAIRQDIQELCRKAAAEDCGTRCLTVPTGGGKTIASIVWAVDTAIRNSSDRIIIAIPYTSIISQTASVLRSIFGSENVVEHHSNIVNDIDDEQHVRTRLSIENWDAPIIITTNVQLFESLYSNKPSDCRKLHNIVHSVIILDETQMLPASLLHPIIDILRTLNDTFGVSLLLTTASQPAIDGHIGQNRPDAFEGLSEIREIIPDPKHLAEELKRVRFTVRSKSTPLASIAEELNRSDCVLCIVNTRREASKLYNELCDISDRRNLIHLSRSMCSAHIMAQIAEIRQRLEARNKHTDNTPLRVISTQLIEAGIDLDFPVVYRQQTGLDSILQAAGRCNREGKLPDLGNVTVFHTEKLPPVGLMRKGSNSFEELLNMNPNLDLLSPDVMHRYFELLYGAISDFDEAKICELLYDNASCGDFQFASAAQNFKMINDQGKSVVVNWGNGDKLIRQLRNGGLDRRLARQLQQYSVSVSERDFLALQKNGQIEECDGVYVQNAPNLYDSDIGIINNQILNEDILMI